MVESCLRIVFHEFEDLIVKKMSRMARVGLQTGRVTKGENYQRNGYQWGWLPMKRVTNRKGYQFGGLPMGRVFSLGTLFSFHSTFISTVP